MYLSLFLMRHVGGLGYRELVSGRLTSSSSISFVITLKSYKDFLQKWSYNVIGNLFGFFIIMISIKLIIQKVG